MSQALHQSDTQTVAQPVPDELRLVLGCSTEAETAALKDFLVRELGPVADHGTPGMGDAMVGGAPGSMRFRRASARPPVHVLAVLTSRMLRAEELEAARFAQGALLAVHPEAVLSDDVMRQIALLTRLGVQHIALAVLPTGVSGDSVARLAAIAAEFRGLAARIGLAHPEVVAVPEPAQAPWGTAEPVAGSEASAGATLEPFLTAVERDVMGAERRPFRLLVESAGPGPQGGTVVVGSNASGRIGPGERIRIQPMGKESRATAIDFRSNTGTPPAAGRSITLTLEDAVEIPAGSVVSAIESPASVADQFEATLVWLHHEPLYPARRYRARIGAQTADFTVTDVKYVIHVATGERLAASQLEAGAMAVCNVSLNRPVAFDPFRENPVTGFLTVLDRDSGEPLGIGLLHFALRRAENIHIQHVDINKAARAAQKTQKPCVIWFTGLSGSGKSTIANRVEQQLYQMGHHTYLLDGDNVRHGLNRDLGFTEADRVENIRRVGEVAKLMVDAGLIVLTAFISPFRTERQMARDLLTDGEFIEVFVDVPLAVAEQRDPKGLYKKARRGQLKNFTGIDSPYEVPDTPELILDTAALTPEEAADRVITALRARGRLLT